MNKQEKAKDIMRSEDFNSFFLEWQDSSPTSDKIRRKILVLKKKIKFRCFDYVVKYVSEKKCTRALEPNLLSL